MNDHEKVVLRGSGSALPPDARPLAGVLDASDVITLTLLLRRRRELPDDLVEGCTALSREGLADTYGADPADLELVRKLVHRCELQVLSTDIASRRVVVSGTLAALSEAFGVQVAAFDGIDPFSETRLGYRSQLGDLHIPVELDGVVVGIFGLDTRPQARPAFRTLEGRPQLLYTTKEIAKLYGFPEGTDGTGQTLAIISIGGGYQREDMEAYFAELDLPVPKITDVGIDGLQNQPGGEYGEAADLEMLLDIQIAGSLAPGAHLVNYIARNTEQSIYNALHAAVHASPTPTAVSLSWGSSEVTFSQQLLRAGNDLLAEAAALGITVCAASGDAGSGNNQYDGGSHVNFPASSPYALGCGGTTLIADPETNTIHSETAWNSGTANATGGGVSDVFDLPVWQAQAGVPDRYGRREKGRGVPDVAAVADPMTGYQIIMQGELAYAGGTSAATPLWAALICRLAEALGRPLGLLQPLIYHGLVPGEVTEGFRDVVSGDNGAYAAGPGWDPNTGLGVPVGAALLAALRDRLLAEDTRTHPDERPGPEGTRLG